MQISFCLSITFAIKSASHFSQEIIFTFLPLIYSANKDFNKIFFVKFKAFRTIIPRRNEWTTKSNFRNHVIPLSTNGFWSVLWWSRYVCVSQIAKLYIYTYLSDLIFFRTSTIIMYICNWIPIQLQWNVA